MQEYGPVVRVSAAEYRQDSGRERYMVRPLDVNTFDPLPGAAWRDYLGEDIYGDYGVTLDENEEPVVTEGTAYLAGVG